MSGPNNGNEKPKGAINVDPSDICEAVGYLLVKEYNRHIAFVNKIKDLKLRGIINKEIEYMKGLLKRLHIDEDIKEKDIKGKEVIQ